MAFLICAVPVCPVRAEASHRSEQVSQLLFGETCEVLETDKEFVKVKVLYDEYEGWCQRNQLEDMEHIALSTRNKAMAGDWVNEIMLNNYMMKIPFGSEVGFLPGGIGVVGKYEAAYNGAVIEPGGQIEKHELIVKTAFTFLNTPYQWGGRSVFGVDCSGFTQLVYKCLDIPLKRDAYQQANQGHAIGFLPEVKSGDLAFFDNDAGRITHVGILLNANTIIHASGKVRVDAIDNFGIINSETQRRTHTLRVIKRVINV